ncbi:50S ribosomal protein L32 [bacterium]|nr:50S ribosomal protein L32 [bacterium]|tara:strand:- start:23689 stop:23991 length:303 start_codon:yes stop_codon:yes gene_type:complete
MGSRMRVTKGHGGNRRSHHALSEPGLSECSNCGAKHLRHRACQNCGQYKGRSVFDVLKRTGRLLAKKEARQKERQVAPEEKVPEEKAPKALSAEGLSKRD